MCILHNFAGFVFKHFSGSFFYVYGQILPQVLAKVFLYGLSTYFGDGNYVKNREKTIFLSFLFSQKMAELFIQGAVKVVFQQVKLPKLIE